MNKFIIFWMTISLIFECFGDYFAKKWSLTTDMMRNFWYSLGAYNVMILSWLAVMDKTKNLSLTGTIWLLLGQLLILFVGIGIFHETLSTTQMIGVGLAVLSLLFLSI